MAKTITDIIPPSRRRQMENNGEMPSSVPGMTAVPPVPPPPQAPPRPLSDTGPEYVPGGRPNSGRSFPWGIALVAFLIVVGSGVALYAFADAKVTITPTARQTAVTGDFTANFNASDLPYQIVTVEKTVSANVPAESTETVNDPAQGSIVISNAQDAPQTLIKNTRFQSPGGLIFRIQDSVTIPGGSISSPGTKQVTVYADTGGEQYNIGPSNFTVPGLKGSATYDKVTAKSTESFTGGFSGTRASVSEATRTAQNEKIRSALDEALSAAVSEKLPAGYVVIPGSTFVTYTPTSDTVGKGNTVNVNLKGTEVAVVLQNAGLAKAIAYKVIGSYSGQNVYLSDVTGLKVTPVTPGTPTAEQGSFAFSLTGNTTVAFDVDVAKIRGAVAGKNRTAAYTIIQGFPEVSRAILTVRPFWKSSFPADPANISVATTSPSE